MLWISIDHKLRRESRLAQKFEGIVEVGNLTSVVGIATHNDWVVILL